MVAAPVAKRRKLHWSLHISSHLYMQRLQREVLLAKICLIQWNPCIKKLRWPFEMLEEEKKMKQKQQIWIDLEQMQCKRQHEKTS